METSKNTQNGKTTPGFPWLESEQTEKFGCTHKALHIARVGMLLEGKDFIRHKRRVCLSDAGMRKLWLSFGLPEQDSPVAQKEPARPGPVLFTLLVHPRKTLNPHVIQAILDNKLCRVRVKTKTNFRPYMKVTCRHVGADLYELVGNCPRFPGKY